MLFLRDMLSHGRDELREQGMRAACGFGARPAVQRIERDRRGSSGSNIVFAPFRRNTDLRRLVSPRDRSR